MASSSKLKVEKYKKGRSRGGIYTVPSGERCFLATSKLAYIFCAGEKTISDAVRKNVACWSMDEETLMTMRTKGIRFLGVLCKENDDIYLTRTDAFLNRELTVSHARARQGRRYLPLSHFGHRSGRVRF